MRVIWAYIILFLVVSCSKEDTTLEQYATHPVQFDKKEIRYPKDEFTLFIPQNWEWNIENYEDEQILLGVDIASPVDENGHFNIMSIQKLEGIDDQSSLESEFESILELHKTKNSNFKIVDSGKTSILNGEAYFIHTKSDTNTYGEIELINFFVEGEEKGTYYSLSASSPQNEMLKQNMAIMLQSLRTFKLK
jgi:hypothetical protein